MKQYIQLAKAYIADHRKQLATGTRIAAGVVVLGFLVALIIYDRTPHYAYQPVKACDIFTPAKAIDLLGEKVNSVDKNTPTVSDNVATSKCGYTDINPDTNNMLFAAVAVQSGIDDTGVAKNKTDFAEAKSNNDVETVQGFGQSAYFNKTNGQLNILDGHKWIIVSYGVSSAPNATTVDKLVEVAHKILK